MKICFYLTIFFIPAISCTPVESNSTLLDSDEYENKEERINRLETEIVSSSAIQDAEFELFNVNGFHNQRQAVPGASSWDYKFAVRIAPANIPNWTNGLKEVELEDMDDSWTGEITKQRSQNWRTFSNPHYFIGQHVTLVVYEDEGIVFKRVIN